MPRRSIVLWSLAALAGLLLAAGVTLAASSLSSQRIGLSAEPLSAGDDLAPSGTADVPPPRAADKATPTPTATRTPSATRTPTPTPIPTPARTVAPATGSGDDNGGSGGSDDSGASSGSDDSGGGGDDSSGRGRGRGRGRGGENDD